MVRPFLSTRLTETTIPRLRARGLETRLQLDGRPVRFRTPDGVTTDAIEVVVEWTNQQADETRGTTEVSGIDGNLHARPHEAVGILVAGTLFQIDGSPCEITRDALNVQGVGIVPFTMTGGAA